MISIVPLAGGEAAAGGAEGPPLGAREALDALAARPGYLRGTLARSTDDLSAWVLLTEWADVGSYRRALGHPLVKLHATTLLAGARDVATSFEALVEVAPGGEVTERSSDHA